MLLHPSLCKTRTADLFPHPVPTEESRLWGWPLAFLGPDMLLVGGQRASSSCSCARGQDWEKTQHRGPGDLPAAEKVKEWCLLQGLPREHPSPDISRARKWGRGATSVFTPCAGRRNCVNYSRKGRPVSLMVARISPPAFTGHPPNIWRSFTFLHDENLKRHTFNLDVCLNKTYLSSGIRLVKTRAYVRRSTARQGICDLRGFAVDKVY